MLYIRGKYIDIKVYLLRSGMFQLYKMSSNMGPLVVIFVVGMQISYGYSG